MTEPATIIPRHPHYFLDYADAARAQLAQSFRLWGVTLWPGADVPPALVYLAAAVVGCAVIIGVLCLTVMVLVYLERKVSGHIQSRLGPMYVGWHGVLQSIADVFKLLAKEDLIPDNALRFLYSFAPALVLVGAFAPFAALPFAQNLVMANMDIGLFYIIGFASIEVIGVIMAGWASSSKWSLFGGMRLAAQMMSYELPLGLSVMTIIILAGSLNLNDIVMRQETLPYVLQSPFGLIAFILYYIAGLASAKRAPFDLPEAESELVSGFHTEYSGMRFGFFFLAEYASMTLISAVGSLVFLGGWNFPFSGDGRVIVGLLQLGVKTAVLLMLMLWLRWTLPRIRIDQVMHMCFKVLLPLGMICVLGAGIEAVSGAHAVMWALVLLLVAATYIIGRKSNSFAPARAKGHL
ncbi:MAG: NADH-quinone oxidoreductase subunit NuoH [Candidatus Sumerlaeota bacterium]|nr:NADH-quinone oxidoreductase subunit NuoH [Candidatus Sumerlaeota bacterium]